MDFAFDLLTTLADASKKKEFSSVARQLRRSMQVWDVSFTPRDSLRNEDVTIVIRFWRKLYSLDEMALRKEAVRLYGLCIAADTDWTFTPLTRMAGDECERMGQACDELLADLRFVHKVVSLRPGAPRLEVIKNPSLTSR